MRTNASPIDVIIVGSGPAGLTAAVYAHRFGLRTVVVAGKQWGGQLQLTTDVENFPGLKTILGPELMKNMREHVAQFGVEILDENAVSIDTSSYPFTVKTETNTLSGKTVIIATGADHLWLNVPGEAELRGRGVSSCAPCDAFFFRNRRVAVVGGGDSAMEEAQVLAKVASEVILIHRRDSFRAQEAMIEKVRSEKNVRFLYNTTVVRVLGNEKVTGLLVKTKDISKKQGATSFENLFSSFSGKKEQGNTWKLPVEGVFVAIGLRPNTGVFDALQIDDKGYLVRLEEKDGNGNLIYSTKTNIDGIFTAGDVHDYRYRQAVTAAGFGCMAALDAQRWLSERNT